MSDTNATNPETIEREIRRTQEEMSQTVDKIGGQLNIKSVFNALLDKADENNIDARKLYDGARRNPVALGLIAAGAIWLVSDRDAQLPSLGRTDTNDKPARVDSTDYVSHMSGVESRTDEDPVAYQRRRDLARSNYFMMERGHEEDESSFRNRLDAMTDKYRGTRHAWAETAKTARESTGRATQAAASKAQELYNQNPLIGGLLAAIVGAVAATSVPITDVEQAGLGDLGRKAKDALGASTDKMGVQLRETKDQLLDKAEASLHSSASEPQQRDTGVSRPFIAAQ